MIKVPKETELVYETVKLSLNIRSINFCLTDLKNLEGCLDSEDIPHIKDILLPFMRKRLEGIKTYLKEREE